MKFSEVKQGHWFRILDDKDGRYLKIDQVVDKYDNIFVAVNDCGFLLDSIDITESTEVELLLGKNNVSNSS